MLGWLTSLLSGGIVRSITDIVRDLSDTKVRLANAQTEQDRIRYQAEVDKYEAELSSATAIISSKQSQGGWIIVPQVIMGLSFAIYVAKLLVWDKVLGLGATDPLTGDLREWAWVILGGYFTVNAVAIGASTIAGAIVARRRG